jgi:hypothetical protein
LPQILLSISWPSSATLFCSLFDCLGYAQQRPAEARCLEMMLMNFDYRGAVNFFAIIIGH